MSTTLSLPSVCRGDQKSKPKTTIQGDGHYDEGLWEHREAGGSLSYGGSRRGGAS